MVEGGGSVRMNKILVRFKGIRILPPSSQGHLPSYFQTINRHINEYIHKLRISIFMHAAKKRFSKIAKLLPNDESSPFAPPGALRAPQELPDCKTRSDLPPLRAAQVSQAQPRKKCKERHPFQSNNVASLGFKFRETYNHRCEIKS